MSSVITQLTFHFPALEKFFPIFGDAFNQMHQTSKALLSARENNPDDTRQNLTKMMIDLKNEVKKDEAKRKVISDDVIYAQPAVMFLGGLETTATLLTNFFYILATQPTIQEELIKEVDEFMADHDDFAAEDLSSLEYLEACILECLRLYAPITQHNRVCTEDVTIKGIK